ncbi:MAG: alpha/beta hydrolase [Leptolyngbyaceae cyanobacterium RM1_406_9]|nr:alpha/beta hydrolase [Leptolyngbyaceae cyanobacterium RM1_406_9]
MIFSLRSLRSNRYRFVSRFVTASSLIAGTIAITLSFSQPARSAERIYLTYGPLGRSLPIADLREFADTGEPSRQIRWYLNWANVEPELLREILIREVSVELKTVDQITYSLPGEFALFEVGQVIHTRSRRANIQALRSALILSVSDNNRLSLLEFLEKYPTQGIYVDGVKLAQIASNVRNFVDDVDSIVVAIQEFLAGLVCECENNQITTIDQ